MQIEITKQSEKDFRFLLSRLSHEIRNPVTLINSELQLMASSHPELCSYRQWDSLMDNLEYVKELLKDVEHTSSPVFLDRIKMRQVIFNLIKNSCEAIDQPGGKIIVNLTPADSGICICIKDNGCGMTHKQTENIFHPFITYKPEGTGLGLAVTAEIISAHHGQIRVSSTPGQGSAFYIYLPASPE